jgi:uncharacterized SAM-binding protein YcdF (DUF218 family)
MRYRRWLILVLCGVLLAGYLLSRAGIFLASPAQQPLPSDAMIILGGDAGARTMRGIELYRRNLSRLIILIGLEDGETVAQPFYLNWRSQMLIAAGIPKDSIEFDAASKNSWEEASATLKLAQARGWKRIMVVSDPPHLRRLLWVWSKTFEDSGVEVVLVAGTPWWWNAEKWWTSEPSAKFVVNEYIKLGYYFLKYSNP